MEKAADSKKLSIGLLYDDTFDSTDGVAHQVKELGSWLTQQGHHVFYMCGETTTKQWAGGPVYSLSSNLKVSFNNNRLSTPIYSSGKKISKVLKTERPDVIHVQMPYSPIMAQRVIARASKDSAIVSTFHIFPSGSLVKFATRLLGLVQYFSIRKIDKQLAVSQAAANFARQAFGIKPLVVPNMVNIEALSAIKSKNISTTTIVYLGRLVDRKGCKQLIQAFKIVSDKHPNIKLKVGGKGPELKNLKKLVNSLGLDQKVEFVGYIDEVKKPGFLASGDIACFPSLYGESFGIVLVEAMAAGSGAIIGGNNPGYATVLAPQPKTLIDPNNTQEFAQRILEFLDNKSLFDEIHAWQQQYVKQFDVNVVGNKILDVYAEAIAIRAKSKA